MEVLLKNIIPFSEARSNLSGIISKIKEDKFYVISKKNKPKAVLVDLDYFTELKKMAEKKRFDEDLMYIREKFTEYVSEKIDKDKEDITDEDVYKYVSGGKDLVW